MGDSKDEKTHSLFIFHDRNCLRLSQEDLEDLLFLLKSNVADDRLSQAPVRRFHKRYYNNLDHLARMNFKRSDPALQSLKQQQMSNFRRQQRFSNLNTRHMLGGL